MTGALTFAAVRNSVDGISAHAVNRRQSKIVFFATRTLSGTSSPVITPGYEIKNLDMFRCPVSSGFGKNTGRPECQIGTKSTGRNPCP